jgi:hypothetical protein
LVWAARAAPRSVSAGSNRRRSGRVEGHNSDVSYVHRAHGISHPSNFAIAGHCKECVTGCSRLVVLHFRCATRLAGPIPAPDRPPKHPVCWVALPLMLVPQHSAASEELQIPTSVSQHQCPAAVAPLMWQRRSRFHLCWRYCAGHRKYLLLVIGLHVLGSPQQPPEGCRQHPDMGKKRKAAVSTAAGPEQTVVRGPRPAAHHHTDAAPTGIGLKVASAPGRLANG